MVASKASLLIPIENQVRELDAKLLLACVAARRGLSSVIGPKRIVESRASTFPPGIYLSKSLLYGHSKFLRDASKLGHRIAAWDEDALVHLPADTYFSRRLSGVTLGLVSYLFAWGEDNAALWRRYPDMPPDIPIFVTGNPRGDLLRPEMRPFYRAKIDEIKSTHGDFILINTNFNHVNAFTPNRNLFLPGSQPEEPTVFGRAARGMTRVFAESLRDQKQAVFEHFQQMIPKLETAFPDMRIVVRPHQVENQAVYKDIAARCRRVTVANEGYVVPWLGAAKVLVHNGCTTSVEAYAMGVPTVSYRAVVNRDVDDGFYRLPHGLSRQCFSFDELEGTIGSILSGQTGSGTDPERQALFDYHLTAQRGPFACERMVDVLEEAAAELSTAPKPALLDRLGGWYKITKRRVRKRSTLRGKGSHPSLDYQQHKHPELTVDQLQSKIDRFLELLGDDRRIRIEQIYPQVFRVNP